MEAPEISIINIVPLQSESLFEHRARIHLRVINPNDVDLSITGFSFHLDINDTRFTRGVSNELFIVPRLGDSKTSVVVTTSMLDIFRQLVDFDKKKNTDYLIQGKVYLGDSRVSSVPFRHSGKLIRD